MRCTTCGAKMDYRYDDEVRMHKYTCSCGRFIMRSGDKDKKQEIVRPDLHAGKKVNRWV